jgi:ABC-type phosphate transport system substrate-binding protein
MSGKLHGFFAALALCAAVITAPANAELAVIAHPSVELVGISKQELKEIYLGRARTFPNGDPVTPLDQPGDSAAYRQFARDVLDMDTQALKSYRAKLMFAGKGKPPQVLTSDAAVKKAVAGNPGALGYVQGRQVDGTVKVLLILP